MPGDAMMLQEMTTNIFTICYAEEKVPAQAEKDISKHAYHNFSLTLSRVSSLDDDTRDFSRAIYFKPGRYSAT